MEYPRRNAEIVFSLFKSQYMVMKQSHTREGSKHTLLETLLMIPFLEESEGKITLCPAQRAKRIPERLV